MGADNVTLAYGAEVIFENSQMGIITSLEPATSTIFDYGSCEFFQRHNNQLQVIGDNDFVGLAENNQTDVDPKNYAEAMSSPHAPAWRKAIAAEEDNLRAYNCWIPVATSDIPPGTTLIPSRFIFKTKYRPDGTYDKRKARLVIIGFRQIGEFETFSPTAHVTTIRLLISIAVQLNFEISTLDIKGAFLEAELTAEDGEIYVEPPPGSTDHKANVVWKLTKSVYGLRVAPRRWYHHFKSFLVNECNLVQSQWEQCIFRDPSSKLICALVVDDLLMVGEREYIDRLQSKVFAEYSGTYLTNPDGYIGLNLNRGDDGSITIDQRIYIEEMANRFHVSLDDSTYPDTPLPTNVAGMPPGTSNVDFQDKNYRALVASLLHAARCTRPDISSAVRFLSTSLEFPTQAHSALGRRVLKYLVKTRDRCLKYVRDTSVTTIVLTGFSDATWNSEYNNRSVTGLVVNSNSGPITWASRTQSLVALSSAESEIQAMLECTKEMISIRGTLGEFLATDMPPTVIYTDNSAALAISNGTLIHRRTKHYALRCAFIRDAVLNNLVVFQWLPRELQIADLLTHAAPSQPHQAMTDEILHSRRP